MRPACVLLLLSAACGPGAQLAGPGLPGAPPPPALGRPAATPASLIVDSEGGTVTASSDSGGSIGVDIPAGALPGPCDVTITEMTGGPAGAAGSVWLVSLCDQALASPATLTLAPPAGIAVDGLAAAYQDASGYWFRQYDVQRDEDGQTISVQASAGGSWALVTIAAQRDLVGPFQLDSGQQDFSAAGTATLQYLGEDPPLIIYAVTGSIAVVSSVCTPDPPLQEPMPLSIAELQPGVKFRWGINGRWDVTCGDGSRGSIDPDFDTLGITNIGCDRAWAGTPVFDPADVAGEYVIDCGTDGQITASWAFLPP
ncbi:MAG TPA: hypothetical protein VLW85_22215 [Myxococcales bacterium]|nr:hypothetical protein [Myxococcales bacterium]